MSKNKLTALEIDAITGNEIIRELTDAEIENLQAEANERAVKVAAQEAQILARQSALAKLKELGLTEEEIAAL